MRIAVVTNAYPPNARGGAGQIAATLVELWREAGHEVRVWETYASWLSRGVLVRLFGHLFIDRKAASFVPEILSWKPDVVVTHNLTGVGLGTGKTLQENGIRWLHLLHDVQLFEPSGQLREDRVTSWQRFWVERRRPIFGVPNLTISPTQWLLDAHARRGFVFATTQVIPNPAPIIEVEDRDQKKTDAWLYVGRLSEDKGADLILDLAKSLPDESFVCIGDGELRTALDHQKNVYCLGALSREEVQVWMKKSFALLMPSRLQENQPTVIVEAFTHHLPVIASPCGGVPETLGEAGIVAELNLTSWQSACQKMLEEHERWTYRAQQRAAHFERISIAEAWARLLEDK